MTKYDNVIDRVYIENPCNEDWELMTGNDQVRFCSHCAKDVHNISTLARRDAERLVLEANGNLCVRYYRNPDGTKIMDEHPTRFHQLPRRVSRLAAGAFTVALSISSTAVAQSSDSQKTAAVSKRKMKARKIERSSGSISGVLSNSKGEKVPNAMVRLESRESEEEFETESDVEGRYAFDNLPPGIYQISASEGFHYPTYDRIILTTNQTATFDLSLSDTAMMATAGAMMMRLPSDPLVMAATQNDVEGVKALLDVGVDVNKLDESIGTTALFEAVSKNNVEITKLLLAAGAKVNGVEVIEPGADNASKMEAVPIFTINTNTGSEMIDILAGAGANLNQKDDRGSSPIVQASSYGNAAVVKKLIERGANINDTDSDGRTPLMEAMNSGDLDKVKVLIAAGANVNLTDNRGRTALMTESSETTAEIVAALLEAKPALDAKDKEGTTALVNAALNDKPDIVQLLIDAGAGIDEADDDGFTALMNAAAKGNVDVVEILIAAGADVNARDKSGTTALTIARGHNKDGDNGEVIRILKEHGAIK